MKTPPTHHLGLTFFTLLLAALPWLAGCATHADPKLVGTYHGPNNESLVFASDTLVTHIATPGGSKRSIALGYVVPEDESHRSLVIRGWDATPFLGTTFEFDTNFANVAVTWESRNYLRADVQKWQTNYHRGPAR